MRSNTGKVLAIILGFIIGFGGLVLLHYNEDPYKHVPPAWREVVK